MKQSFRRPVNKNQSARRFRNTQKRVKAANIKRPTRGGYAL